MTTEFVAIAYSGQANKNTRFDNLNALCEYILATPDCTGQIEVDDDTVLEIHKYDNGDIRIRKNGVFHEITEFSVSGMAGKFNKIEKPGGWVHVNYVVEGGYELAASASLGNYAPATKNPEFLLQIKADLLKFSAKKLLSITTQKRP
jgi:hypothetical protein